MVAFVGRSLTAQAADQATVRAQQIADDGVRDGGSIVVGDPEEQFVQVLRGSTVVASSANVAGLPALAIPGPEDAVGVRVPTVAGPFIAASAVAVGVDGPRTVVVGLNVDDVDDARHVVALALLAGVPLIDAVKAGNTETVRALVAKRADVNTAEADGTTALHWAAHFDNLAAADLLIRAGANVKAANRYGATPLWLACINGSGAMVEKLLEHPETTNLEELAGVVLEEDARLQGLVDDLLLLARLDEHVRPARFDEVDLDDVVLAEASRLRGATSLIVDTRGVSTARILGRRADLERIVRNLTDNALHHARERIWLAVGTSDGHVALTVDDDGPGIASADRERVLERFVRLDGDRGRATGGSGLGLSIVREVALSHGGGVALGRSPQGGLRAEVRFPAP